MAVDSSDFMIPSHKYRPDAFASSGRSHLSNRRTFVTHLKSAVHIFSRILSCSTLDKISELRILCKLLERLGANVSIVQSQPKAVSTMPHVFLQVIPPNWCGNAPILVDPEFRAMLHVPRPSDLYQQLLEIVPAIFVGDWKECGSILRDIIPEIEDSFQQAGMPTPPWRTLSGLSAYWQNPCPLVQDDFEADPWLDRAVHLIVAEIIPDLEELTRLDEPIE